MNCLTKNVARFTPSLKHFGAVAEKIAKNPITTRNVTIMIKDLSGGDKITSEVSRFFFRASIFQRNLRSQVNEDSPF